MTQDQILALLLINAFSAAFQRLFVAKGELVMKRLSEFQYGRRNLAVIAGFWNQSDRAFQYIKFPERLNLFALNFSNFGYNPIAAGRAFLRPSMRAFDYICAISVGAKAVEYSTMFGTSRRIMLICPCSHPTVLQPFFRWATRILSPVLELISFGLGWLAFLPIIPIKLGGRASIALVADQLFWIAYGNPKVDGYQQADLVMSQDDELLLNGELERIYQTAHSKTTVDGLHARTDIPEMAGGYESAIAKIFTN